MVPLMYKALMFCQFFLSNDTRELTAKWMLYTNSSSVIFMWPTATARHSIFFIWNLIVDFINFGHQVLIVGQQGRELAGLVQAWAQDSGDLLDQRL